MANFVTSDLHLGHRNVIQYCPESRGHFNSVDEMNETIVTNINSMVSDNDTLYILGDIAFMAPGKACDYLKRINGEKVVVWGNHDRKLRASSEFASQKGLMGVKFDADYVSRHFEVDGYKSGVVMMHFPIYSFEGQLNGGAHVHGHCHSVRARRNTFGDKRRVQDIGMDTNFMMPYNLEDVIREMRTRELDSSDYHAK